MNVKSKTPNIKLQFKEYFQVSRVPIFSKSKQNVKQPRSANDPRVLKELVDTIYE